MKRIAVYFLLTLFFFRNNMALEEKKRLRESQNLYTNENTSSSSSSGIVVNSTSTSNSVHKSIENSGNRIVEDHCRRRVDCVKPYLFSTLNEKCFDECFKETVAIMCNALPVDTDTLEKFGKKTIDELNIDDVIKKNFLQLALNVNVLAPIQRHLISMIIDGEKNIQVSYPNKRGAKIGLLVGIIAKVQRIKAEMKGEMKKGPLAVIVIEESRPARDHIVTKIMHLLKNTNITFSFNNPVVATDISILPVVKFLESTPINLSDLAIFCVFNGEIVLKQVDQNDFVNYVLETIGDHVQTIVSTNRTSGNQRACIHEMVKNGSIHFYNPSMHNP